MKPPEENASHQSAGPAGRPASAGGVDKRVVLLVAATASFLTPFMGSSINIALPAIGGEFGSGAVTLSWISTIYLMAGAMFLVPFGRLADIYGRRKIFLSGMVGYTMVSFLCGLATSEVMLISLRAIQGITDAMMFGTSTAIVTSVYPPAERGRALGITVASVYSGLALGPVIGGYLTQFLGWRYIFYLTTFFGAMVVLLTLWKMKAEWAEARGQRMDVIGSAIYAVTLLAIMLGFRLLPDMTGLWLIVVGAGLLAAFVIRESRVANPVLDISLFRSNTTFALSNLSALINYAATAALGFMLSLYLQYIKGLDPRAAGLILLSQPVMMAVFSPLVGRLSDRVEPRILASVGMALTAAGLFLTAFLNSSSGLGHIVGVLMLCGFGFALFSSPNVSAIMGSVGRAFYGVASATTAAMRLIGQMLSMGIAALIIALFLGQAQITPEHYPEFQNSLKTAFLVFSALCFAGIFASLARGKLHDGRTT